MLGNIGPLKSDRTHYNRPLLSCGSSFADVKPLISARGCGHGRLSNDEQNLTKVTSQNSCSEVQLGTTD